jgi:hypothetical protein
MERLAEAVRMRGTGLHVCNTADVEELELGHCRAMNLLRQLLLDGENTSGRERRIRVCLVACVISECLSHLIQAHVSRAALRYFDLFGISYVFTHAEPRSCLVACIRSDMC